MWWVGMRTLGFLLAREGGVGETELAAEGQGWGCGGPQEGSYGSRAG